MRSAASSHSFVWNSACGGIIDMVEFFKVVAHVVIKAFLPFGIFSNLQ